MVKKIQLKTKKQGIPKGKLLANPAKLKPGLEPGRILILLNGRFKGKRVVFLKTLGHTGMLLVTGPYEVNGVPLKRVPQAYTIVTSAKVDVKALKGLDKISEAFFNREKAKKTKQGEDEFFASQQPTAAALPEAKKATQKEIDAGIMSGLKDEILKKYLKTRFSLSDKDKPHAMKF